MYLFVVEGGVIGTASRGDFINESRVAGCVIVKMGCDRLLIPSKVCCGICSR